MNYYIDFEFIEDFHKPLFGRRRHYIDMISIGIVDESGREYYAVSKDFDLKAVWNRRERKHLSGDMRNHYPKGIIEYWLRDNVVKPLFFDLWNRHKHSRLHNIPGEFTYRNVKHLIALYGKTNKQIIRDVMRFIYPDAAKAFMTYEEKEEFFQRACKYGWESDPAKQRVFYGYYCDYDWVLFCSLFGRMVDLPAGFPMYCRDVKQMADELLECHPQFRGAMPTPFNSHLAIDDARYTKRLHQYVINPFYQSTQLS